MTLMATPIGASPALEHLSTNLRAAHAGHSLYSVRGRRVAGLPETQLCVWALTKDAAAEEFRVFLLEEQVSHLTQATHKDYVQMAESIEVVEVLRILTLSADMGHLDVAYV